MQPIPYPADQPGRAAAQATVIPVISGRIHIGGVSRQAQNPIGCTCKYSDYIKIVSLRHRPGRFISAALTAGAGL
jgi:hypothetical protein